MGGGQLICPKGCPASEWGFPWGVGWPGQGACGDLQGAHSLATQGEALVSGIYLSSIIEIL